MSKKKTPARKPKTHFEQVPVTAIKREGNSSSNERYRCHVCRLSLNFDAQTRKLVVTEFEGDHDGDHYVQPAEPKPARRLPTPVDDRRKETRRPAYRAKTA